MPGTPNLAPLRGTYTQGKLIKIKVFGVPLMSQNKPITPPPIKPFLHFLIFCLVFFSSCGLLQQQPELDIICSQSFGYWEFNNGSDLNFLKTVFH
jgi:hypothetical protein